MTGLILAVYVVLLHITYFIAVFAPFTGAWLYCLAAAAAFVGLARFYHKVEDWCLVEECEEG